MSPGLSLHVLHTIEQRTWGTTNEFPPFSVVATDLIRWHQEANIWTCLWKVLLLHHFLWWPGAGRDHKGSELPREGTCLT